jgi:hypothetical protein
MYLTKALALRSHFGLQNGWIHQHSDVEYARSFVTTPGASTSAVSQLVKLKNKFWGIGLRTGLDGEWKLGYGFSLLGKVAGSILSGRTNSRKSQYSAVDYHPQDLGQSYYTEVYRDTDKVKHLSPGLETAFGLNWGMCLGNSNMYLGFNVNWESQYWWNQFHYLMPAIVQDVGTDGSVLTYTEVHSTQYPFDNDGALNLEGITVKARFDF